MWMRYWYWIYFIGLDFIKHYWNNLEATYQRFIEYVEFKDINSENMFELTTLFISLSSLSTIFIGQTYNIIRQEWIRLKWSKVLNNFNIWVRKLILGNIFNVDEVFGRKPDFESML